MRIRRVTGARRQSDDREVARSSAGAARASASGESWQPTPTSLQGQGPGWQPWLGAHDEERYLQPALRRRRRSSSAQSRPDEREALKEPPPALDGMEISGPELAACIEQERAERVALLRVRVAAGAYEVDSLALARRMLGDPLGTGER